MTNFEARMNVFHTRDVVIIPPTFGISHLTFVIRISFVISYSSFVIYGEGRRPS